MRVISGLVVPGGRRMWRRVLTCGVIFLLAVVSGYAEEATVASTWFQDSAAAGSALPPASGRTSVVGLFNTASVPYASSIAYFDATGVDVGTANDSSTLTLPSMWGLYFRPFADDPALEGVAGAAVPNRGTTDGKTNGSLAITFPGYDGDVKMLQAAFEADAVSSLGESTYDGFYGTGASVWTAPWFMDDAAVGKSTSGVRTFIVLRNNLATAMTCEVRYWSPSGTDITPVPSSFDLPAKSLVAWRPAASDLTAGGHYRQMLFPMSPRPTPPAALGSSSTAIRRTFRALCAWNLRTAP